MNGTEIDWNFINKINNWGPIVAKDVPISKRLDFIFDANLYKDCVFYRCYKTDANTSKTDIKFYDSIQVTDFKPASKWPGSDGQYETFEHYYKKKYNLEIYNKTQSLIEGQHVNNCAQLKPFVIGKSKDNNNGYFVPELVAIHPFPSTLWRQALCLPAILYRLNHLFLAEELRSKIHSETNPSIGLTNPLDNHLILDFNKDVNDSKHTLTDLDMGSKRHQFDYEIGFNDFRPSMTSKITKKQRTEYSIIINNLTANTSSLGLNTSQSLSAVSKPDNDIVNNVANNSWDVIDYTNAVINRFNDLLLSCGLSASNSPSIEMINTHKVVPEINQPLKYGESFPFIFTGDITDYIHQSYDSLTADPILGPTADVLLAAVTLLGANDAFNLERMETMGDSFLKLVTTGWLYYSCPELDESHLSYLRQMQICNSNLYYIGKRLGISDLLVTNKWYTHKNWLAPNYHITDERDLQLLTDDENTSGAYGRQIINDKSVADAIEALIGAHLLIGGNKSALIFMQWLGLQVSPKGYQIDYIVNNDRPFNWLPVPKSPIWDQEITANEISHFIYKQYNECSLDNFEGMIGYQFKDKAYLIQALTHPSYDTNVFTDCYQKLEFLGDAVLDYLITGHIYKLSNHQFNPGQLTDLRSALVNNAFFASIAVKFNFHRHLKALSLDLFRAIDVFVKGFEDNKVDAICNCFYNLNDEDVGDVTEEVEVPKALGDIFESVAGAIYLDSGLSLDAVWKVYFALLKPEIDYFSANVPKMPVRELREICKKVEFSAAEQLSGQKIRVVVTADGRQYGGVGKNKKLAKIAASKSVLKVDELFINTLQSNNMSNEYEVDMSQVMRVKRDIAANLADLEQQQFDQITQVLNESLDLGEPKWLRHIVCQWIRYDKEQN